jgi:hypothetical protein
LHCSVRGEIKNKIRQINKNKIKLNKIKY